MTNDFGYDILITSNKHMEDLLMNINELTTLANKCSQNLRNIGIPVANVSGYTINSRTSKRLGRCSRRDNQFYIEVSSKILHDKKEVLNTIYHELIHTCPSCFNHGDKWQMYGQLAESKLKLEKPITRCTSVDRTEEYVSQFKYVLKCECCGVEILKDRMCGVVKNPELYIHRVCGGHFTRVR